MALDRDHLQLRHRARRHGSPGLRVAGAESPVIPPSPKSISWRACSRTCWSSRRASSFARRVGPRRADDRRPRSDWRDQHWIDIGTPDAARLHKASKAADRVAVYTHKDPTQFLKQLAGEKIHHAQALELCDRSCAGERARGASRAARRLQPVRHGPRAVCRSAPTTSRAASCG